MKVISAATLLILLGLMLVACNSDTASDKSPWQSHRYTSKIDEALELGEMDRMTDGDREVVCSALRLEGYDPNLYVDNVLAGQSAAYDSFNFRRDFIIGVLIVTATPEGIEDYCAE